MSYPKQSLMLRPTRGLMLDTPAVDAPLDFFTTATNVNFREGLPQRVLGYRTAYSDAITTVSPSEIMHAVNCALSSTNYWLIFEDDGTAWSIEGGNATQIDATLLAAVSNPHEYSSALLNGLPIISNNSDEPVYWAGANLVTLPGWTATESASFIAVFKFHIFAMNISGPGGDFPNLVKWSSAAEPGTVPNSWTPAANNDAGSFELADSSGGVLCAYPLGDSLMIYKRSAVYQVRFVGGNQVFAQRKVNSVIGALTPRSVCDLGGRHLVVSDGDIVITDGANTRPIGEARIRDYLFRTLDTDNYLNLFCVYNKSRGEVLIAYPTSGNEFCNQGIVYDVSTDSFSLRDLTDTTHAAIGLVTDGAASLVWNAQTQTWNDSSNTWSFQGGAQARDSLLVVQSTSLIEHDTETDVAVNATLSRSGLDFGDPKRVKLVKNVHVKCSDNYGTLLIRVGGSMEPGGTVTWSDEVSLTSPNQIANLFASGRYISVQVRSIGTEVWKISSMEIEAEIRGYY